MMRGICQRYVWHMPLIFMAYAAELRGICRCTGIECFEIS
jgi:hypothetical protein